MKTLWLTYNLDGENKDKIFATLFKGGDITDGDDWIRFDNIEEIDITLEDVNKVLDVFSNFKKILEGA